MLKGGPNQASDPDPGENQKEGCQKWHPIRLLGVYKEGRGVLQAAYGVESELQIVKNRACGGKAGPKPKKRARNVRGEPEDGGGVLQCGLGAAG
jgi:hypothetical protein